MQKTDLTTQEKIDLIKSIAKYGGEIVGEDELSAILESGEELFTYDGFEPSGQMHIAQGILRAINVNKMIKAGFTFIMFASDWTAYLNHKLGGDLAKIQTVGKYFIEIWKASGIDPDNTQFVWSSDLAKKEGYWDTVLAIAQKTTLNRVLKTTQIMGRSDKDQLSASQIIYPCVQCADIFHLGVKVTQLGIDQRKVNMLAREVGPEVGFWKPVVVSHGMLQGLQKPVQLKKVTFQANTIKEEFTSDYVKLSVLDIDEKSKTIKIEIADTEREISNTIDLMEGPVTTVSGTNLVLENFDNKNIEIEYPEEGFVEAAIKMKMSKSKPNTAIFMTDTTEEIREKINKAYCPEGVVEENPILDYIRQIIFEAHHLEGREDLLKDGFVVERPEKFGGNLVFNTYEEIEEAYKKGGDSLHPMDLKGAVIRYIDELIKPVREHFENDANAKELLETVRSFQVTR